MSDKALKRALFVDLELTCWEGEAPPGMVPEIIQIGIAEIDIQSLLPTRNFMRYVKPTVSEISAYCTELTGITQKIMRQARPLDEVARTIRRQFGASPWYAWGDDKAAIDEGVTRQVCEHPLPGPQTNLSDVFHQLYGCEKRLSLADALKSLGITFIGRQHDAQNDAENTALLFIELIRRLRGGVCATGDHGNQLG